MTTQINRAFTDTVPMALVDLAYLAVNTDASVFLTLLGLRFNREAYKTYKDICAAANGEDLESEWMTVVHPRTTRLNITHSN